MAHRLAVAFCSLFALVSLATAQVAQQGVPKRTADDLGTSAVLNASPPLLSLVDNVGKQLLRVIPTHVAPGAVAKNVELSPDGLEAYVMHQDGAITALDLALPAPQPVVISPPAASITPFYAVAPRDLEISPDGRWLVATAFDVAAWQFSIPSPRNRISIYDLAAPGVSAHFFLDSIIDYDAFPDLDVAIDAGNRAWIPEGDFKAVAVVDLATQGVVLLPPTAPPAAGGMIGGGPGAIPPIVDIAVSESAPAWVPGSIPGVSSVLRLGPSAAGPLVDFPYPAVLMYDVEARPGTRFVALSRPAKAAAVGDAPAPDVFVVIDTATGATAHTPKLTGSQHRFREIEFRGDFEKGRVYGIDWAADLFLVADFAPWLANPGVGQPTIATFPLPVATIEARPESDGLTRGPLYVFHDAKGRLGFVSLANGAVIATVDLLPGLPAASASSVDLEIRGDLRCHAD